MQVNDREASRGFPFLSYRFLFQFIWLTQLRIPPPTLFPPPLPRLLRIVYRKSPCLPNTGRSPSSASATSNSLAALARKCASARRRFLKQK